MHRKKSHHWFLPLYETMEMLDKNDPLQQKLILELIQLQEQLLNNHYSIKQTLINDRDAENLVVYIKIMVHRILSAPTQEAAISYIEEFESAARQLPSFQKSTWRMIGKAVACIILAAVGAVIGAVVGAVIEGCLMTALSAPSGGVGGVFGVVSGLIHGSITGWAVGLMAASALGVTSGLACGVLFFKKNDAVDNVAQSAKSLMAARFNTISSTHL